MSPEAEKRTSTLLFGGNIRGASLAPNTAGAVIPLIPGAVFINRSSRVGNIFFDQQLGTTLVHEGEHVDQFRGKTGSEAQAYYDKRGGLLEMVADLYEASNYTCKKAPK